MRDYYTLRIVIGAHSRIASYPGTRFGGVLLMSKETSP